MFPSHPDRAAQSGILAAAVRAIRRRRGLSAKQTATAMGMSLRSYERFESAEGEIRLGRLFTFARVTDCDPFALIAALYLGAPELALFCTDNKLMLIHAMALKRFGAEVGDDHPQLDAVTIITAFTETFDRLGHDLAKRRAWARNWLEDAPPAPNAHSRDSDEAC